MPERKQQDERNRPDRREEQERTRREGEGGGSQRTNQPGTPREGERQRS